MTGGRTVLGALIAHESVADYFARNRRVGRGR